MCVCACARLRWMDTPSACSERNEERRRGRKEGKRNQSGVTTKGTRRKVYAGSRLNELKGGGRNERAKRNGYWTKIYGEKTEDNLMLRVERYLLNAMPLCGAVTKLTGSRLGSAGPARPGRLSRWRSAHPPPGARASEGGTAYPRRRRRRYRLRRASAPLRLPSATSPVIHFAEGCSPLSLSLPRTLATGPPTSRRRFSFQKNLACASGLLSGSPPNARAALNK